MKDKYIDLIEQTFDFPQDEFTVEDNELNFHDIPLMELIKQYGTPLICNNNIWANDNYIEMIFDFFLFFFPFCRILYLSYDF